MSDLFHLVTADWLASYVTVCLVHLTFSLYFWIMTNGMTLAVVRLNFPISNHCDLLPSYFLFRLSNVHCRASCGYRSPFKPQPSPLSWNVHHTVLRQRETAPKQLPTPFTSANTTYAPNIQRLDCFSKSSKVPVETWPAAPRQPPPVCWCLLARQVTSKSLNCWNTAPGIVLSLPLFHSC